MVEPVSIRETANGDPYGLTVEQAGSCYVVTAPGWFVARVTLEGEVTSVQPAESVPEEVANALVDDHVRPRLAQLRGRPSLHASAAVIHGRAVAFQGRSGAGKSTLATLMTRVGGSLIADDAVPLELEDGLAYAVPTSRASSLHRATAERLQLSAPVDASGTEKVWLPLPSANTRVPLARLYVLGNLAATPTITPLKARDAIAEVAGHLHRLDPVAPHLLARELEFLEAVTRAVPVARLAHPRKLEEHEALVGAILRDLGLPV